MAEQLPEAATPRTYHEPAAHQREIERRNFVLGWALFALVLLIFGGTIAIAYIYLALD
jgi:hypothetical protein